MSRPSITFTQPGVQPPVYVVTSLSSPPWETLELNVAEEKTASGDLIFTRRFENVSEGSYQYKIRIGEGYWVVDESKETATDESGNRNNVINVKAEVESPSLPSSTDMFSAPTPFVVVDKVADKDRPEYGDVEHATLSEDASKRTADAEPDFEKVQPETPSEKENRLESPPVPIIVVEKIDDAPTNGDDFGKDATSAQKVAHELRAADAIPDKVIVSPDPNSRSSAESEEQTAPLFPHDSTELQQKPLKEHEAPLFHHESVQPETTTNGAAADRISTVDVIEEESARSSTDQESSHAGLDTPSEISEVSEQADEAVNEPVGELDNGPLLSHEPGFPNDEENDEDIGELDNGPLLSHETEFSGYERSEDVTGDKILQDDYVEDEDDLEFGSERGPTFQYETNGDDDYGSEAPLLPHERDSNEPTDGSEVFGLEDGEQTFDYETGTATAIRFFVNSVNSNSSLPDRLPRSDEEDEDLQDPLLERFPTNREQILERVATIGSHIPVDETRERGSSRSPEFSIQSQTCSSVDLKTITSHTSLKPVDEEDLNDSEAGKAAADDPLTVHPQSRTPSESKETNGTASSKLAQTTESSDVQSAGSRSQTSSETESLQKNDGANDSSKNWGKLATSIATPAKILNPLTPPLTPEREVQNLTDDTRDIKDIGDTQLKPRSGGSPTRTGSQDPAPQKENWFRAFIHFLTACLGGRKQASGAVLVVVIAAAAYYYLYGTKS